MEDTVSQLRSDDPLESREVYRREAKLLNVAPTVAQDEVAETSLPSSLNAAAPGDQTLQFVLDNFTLYSQEGYVVY